MWKKAILPKLGHRKTDQVERRDVFRIHNSSSETPYQANRVPALLSRVFDLAELWGWRDQNSEPTDHIRRDKETKRERLISKQRARLAEVLDEVEETVHVTVSPGGGGIEVLPSVPAALRFLIFTGTDVWTLPGSGWVSVKRMSNSRHWLAG